MTEDKKDENIISSEENEENVEKIDNQPEVDQNLSIWEHTAGWFEYQTGLDNSELILPDNPTQNSYKIINHCRWNHLVDIMPSLLFKPSFRGFVLKNFESNNIAAIPILYRLA